MPPAVPLEVEVLTPQHTAPEPALVSAHEFLLAKCLPVHARNLFNEALNLLQEHREVGLTELWMQAWRGLVVCGVLLQTPDVVIDNAGAILSLEPLDSWALAMRARASQQLKDVEAAHEDWKNASLLEPCHPLLQEWSAQKVTEVRNTFPMQTDGPGVPPPPGLPLTLAFDPWAPAGAHRSSNAAVVATQSTWPCTVVTTAV